jgi:hypothetical protein
MGWPMRLRNTSFDSPLKLAELTSITGAGVLGLGLGAHFGDHLNPFQFLLLPLSFFRMLSVCMMFDKHRLASPANSVSIFWTNFLYWICWASMAGLIVYFIFLQRGDL